MCCTRRVIIYQYFINAGFICYFSYENTVNLAFQPPIVALIGVINDLQRQDIGIELALAHVLYTSSHYQSIFHQWRIYLEPFQNRNRNRVWI